MANTVLNPANVSAFMKSQQAQIQQGPIQIQAPQQAHVTWLNEFATIPPKLFERLHSPIQGLHMNNILHQRLKDKILEIINDIKSNMLSRFSIILPYDEVQSMLMSEATLATLQVAGKNMTKQYLHYNYKLGKSVTINLVARGGKEMPSILFPSDELTNFSEEFLDLIRPLYLITKSWIDVQLAFEAVYRIVQDTRELTFYVSWLRHIMPQNDLTNEFNAKFRVTQWLDLDREKHATIDMITRQVKSIINNEHTSKRTWMPSELVQMVRQGEELITQYNIMKSVAVPNRFLTEDHVSVEVVLVVENHPTIKWASEAHTHRTINEVERLRVMDEKRANKLIEDTLGGRWRSKW